MKTIRSIFAVAVIVLASPFASQAITNTTASVSGTNIVLSWPSYGYESYLIQYRQTLGPTDSWSTVTNAYPANSTNRTKFYIYGVAPLQSHIVGNTNHTHVPPPPAMGLAVSGITTSTVLVESPNGGTAPLALYPPGFNLSGLTILDPNSGESINGTGYTVSARTLSAQPLDQSSGGSPAPTTGFYRVFHIPDWLNVLAGYPFDGPTFLPVDYAAPDAPEDFVDSTTVLINGQPTDNAAFTPYVSEGVTNWGVGIYFDRFANGTYTIQLLSTVRQSGAINDQTPYMVFSNAPQTILIANAVTYTNWSDLILSNTYTFNAQSTVPAVNWEIDIYDVNNNFVNSQTGYSASGNISWTWNLIDYNGNSRIDDSDPFFYPYITISTASGNVVKNNLVQFKTCPSPHFKANTAGTPSPMPPVAASFPSQGSWAFAYLDHFYTDGSTNYPSASTYFPSSIHTMEGGPTLYSLAAWDDPLKFGRTYSQADRNASWHGGTNVVGLTSYLNVWSVRNFYYFGHGAPNGIGGDISVVDSSNNIIASTNFLGSQAYLSSQWVHDNITFNKYGGSIPFRFVFLDGCDTAATNANWPWAWGVPSQAEPLSYYRSASNASGARPSAFVGWDTEVGGPAWGTIAGGWQFRTFWMGNWSVQNGEQNDNLKDVFDQALTGSSWVSPSQLHTHMKIYGYSTMKFLEYNYSGQWP